MDPFVQHLVGRGTVPMEASDSEASLLVSVCKEWEKQSEGLRIIRDCGQELLILDKLREYIATVHEQVILKRFPDLGEITSGFMVEYVAVAYFGILMRWLENDLVPSAETVGRLLYSLTGPPTVLRIMTKYDEQLSIQT